MKRDSSESGHEFKKLLIIGIDGLDPNLLTQWRNDLPTFSELAHSGLSVPMKSVLPADSIPAWATIYTGVDPSEHGMVASIDYVKGMSQFRFDVNVLRGKTFWDAASKAGRRVCILNPFLTYPAWPVNGIMISGPSLSGGEPTAFPASAMNDFEVPELGGFDDFPSRNDLNEILRHCVEATGRLVDFGLRLLEEVDWDLFFICFLTLDRIEHFFWRYGDPGDPYYPGPNRFERTVKDFYILMDKAVGDFYRRTDSNVAFMVLSDHGHCRRQTKLVNMNEFLMRKGFLRPKGKVTPRILEMSRSSAIALAQRLHAERLLFKLGRFFPKASNLRESRYSLDYQNSIATLADFGGSSSFGGIRLNQDAATAAGLDYQSVRDGLAAALLSLKDPTSNRQLVRELYMREQIYRGEHAESFPDIIFELEKDYGIHWSIHDRLVIPDYAHGLVSGGHAREAVFLLARDEATRVDGELQLTDIAPTVLNILGVGSKDQMTSTFRS